MSTPVQLCADKNGLFIFSGRKRQQMRQTGESRPTKKCKIIELHKALLCEINNGQFSVDLYIVFAS